MKVSMKKVIKKRALTNAERQARFRAKRKRQGLVRVETWVKSPDLEASK